MSFRQNPNPNFHNSKNSMEKRGDGSLRTSANRSPFSKPSVAAHPSAWCSNSKTTLANSPSVVEGRNSSSKLRGMSDQKENKKPNPNLKPIKGTKNFMSPTFSAVSKVNPSPRKKALAERNEAVRTSASLSDGKFLFFGSAGDGETENCEFHKKEMHVSCEAKKKVRFDDDVVVLSPEVTSGYDVDEPRESFDFSEMIKSIDFEKNEETETSFVSLGLSPIAPLDADPCVLPSNEPKSDHLSPYDPKTNYLVPRPQFLRYKPEQIDLEDTLSSETSSDNDMETTVDEAESGEAPVQEEKSVEAGVDEDETFVDSEDEASVGRECVEKPGFFRRWGVINWVLFGIVAVMAIMIASRAPPERLLSKVYRYNHADFSGSLHIMKTWSANYLPSMMSSFRETDDEFSPSEFLNFSALVCNANGHFIERSGKVEILKEKGELQIDYMDQSGRLPDQRIDYIEQTAQVELDSSGKSGEDKYNNQSGKPSFPEVESLLNIEASNEEAELLKPVDELELEPIAAFHEEVQLQSRLKFEETELSKSVSEPELEPVAASKDQIHFTEPGTEEVRNLRAEGAAMYVVVSVCLLATAVSSFAILSKYENKSISSQHAEVPSKLKKEESFFGNACDGSRLEAETYSPSEMNSYSFYNNSEAGYESEPQSKAERKLPRRNYKRESLASSSSEHMRGTESYGSFTTYSVMPARQGDEEVVTPIRRSSRISKAQTPLPAARRAA